MRVVCNLSQWLGKGLNPLHQLWISAPLALLSACEFPPFLSKTFLCLNFPVSVEFQPPPPSTSTPRHVTMASSTPVQGVTTVYQTRPILGPLTTEFSAPQECEFAGVQGTPLSVGFWGQTCVGDFLADETTCWPPATAAAPSATPPIAGWGFYSPGISCPAGYTTACDATQGFRTGWDMQFTMEKGETAVGCCPTYVLTTNSPTRGSCIEF